MNTVMHTIVFSPSIMYFQQKHPKCITRCFQLTYEELQYRNVIVAQLYTHIQLIHCCETGSLNGNQWSILLLTEFKKDFIFNLQVYMHAKVLPYYSKITDHWLGGECLGIPANIQVYISWQLLS